MYAIYQKYRFCPFYTLVATTRDLRLAVDCFREVAWRGLKTRRTALLSFSAYSEPASVAFVLPVKPMYTEEDIKRDPSNWHSKLYEKFGWGIEQERGAHYSYDILPLDDEDCYVD